MVDIEAQAIEIANAINAVLEGRDTAAVYLAIGMTLGVMERRTKSPDREQMLRILHQAMNGQLRAAQAR